MSRYQRPENLAEAVEILSRDDAMRIIAGGTDVYPSLGEAATRASFLDITALRELRGIARDDTGWRIGALTTWSDLARADLPPAFDGLRLAGREVGAIQIQNAGTIAGNVVNASPAADGIVALLALDAGVEIAGPAGARVVRLADFLRGPRRVDLARDEIVTALRVPDPGGARAHFLKLGARRHLVISIAMASAAIETGADGRIARARVAIGACSPVARRLTALEERLLGARPDEAADLVRESDADALSPIDDVRASAAYRRAAALVLARRCLATLAAGAR